MNKQTKYFLFLTVTTILFCLAIGFDTIPFLRGPAPYPPEWQWSYLFINTLPKLYLPILISLSLIGFLIGEEQEQIFTKNHELFFIFLTMLLAFFFELSLLFFSRSGTGVLIHRIIDPTLNGYFTASLTIKNIPDFLANYNDTMLSYVYHAKAHPPGAILFFYLMKQMLVPFTNVINTFNQLSPAHSDVKQTWDLLLPIDKATAIVSAFFIPLFSTVSLIPLYFSAKMLYGARVALRSIFVFFFIPTIVFFIPINDAFLHIFSITAFFFLVKGLQENHMSLLFLSGAIIFLGVFFNVSLLPVLLLFFIFALLFLRNKKNVFFKDYLKGGIFFTLGFLLPVTFLNLFFHFNLLQVIQTILIYDPGNSARTYTIWIYYNIQDFLIFCGIPLALLLLISFKQTVSLIIKKQLNKVDPGFLAFASMILVLNFSGSVQGEVGRIWAPYIPFVVLATVRFATNQLNFSKKLFAGVLLLQVVQLLVMQEFWVMLW